MKGPSKNKLRLLEYFQGNHEKEYLITLLNFFHPSSDNIKLTVYSFFSVAHLYDHMVIPTKAF